MLARSMKKRVTHETQMNKQSSRSHAIFTVQIASTTLDEDGNAVKKVWLTRVRGLLPQRCECSVVSLSPSHVFDVHMAFACSCPRLRMYGVWCCRRWDG